ncbi:ABC transporter permease [Roseibium sp. M-1]
MRNPTNEEPVTLEKLGERITLNAYPYFAAISKGIVGALLVIAIYQLVHLSGLVNERVLPSVTLVLSEILNLAHSTDFHLAVLQSIGPALLGLAIACLIAIPLGLLLGTSPVANQSTRGLIDLMRSLPATALIPVFIFTIGVGLQMQLALVIYVTTWPILFNTIYGIASVDKVAIESARTCRVNGFRLWWRVMLPSSAPIVVTGVRYALPISVVIVIASEIVIGSPQGIGGYLLVQQANVEYQPHVIYAILLAAGIVGFCMNLIADAFADRLVGWDTRKGEAS